MNLDRTETQTLLQETVRGYLEREVPLDRIRMLEREQRWDETLWKAVCEQGWLGVPLSEAHGGGGGSLLDAGLLVEEFARRAAIVPVLETLACGRAIQDRAEPQRAGELLLELLSGNLLLVPALLEEDGPDGEVALRVADGRLSGEKPFVDYGQFASHHLVAAREGAEVALFLVEAGRAEVACEPLRSIGRTPLARVRYDAAPAERIAGAEAFRDLLLLARTLSAVQCVGSMQQALDMTVAYARVREQFGRPIGSFQAVQHHCANMAIRVASARLLAFEALSCLESGTASDAQVALAKASASRAAPDVTMLAHQIHGGNGVIEENDLYFFTLRGKESSLAWGSAEECLAVVAERVDEPREWL